MPSGSAGPLWEIQLNRLITEARHRGKGNRNESGIAHCRVKDAACLTRWVSHSRESERDGLAGASRQLQHACVEASVVPGEDRARGREARAESVSDSNALSRRH